jgi:uncharacterized protein (DUF1015 family)
LLRGAPSISSDELKAKLASCFDVRVAGEGGDLAEMIWDQIEIDADQRTIGLYCSEDERWIVAKLNDAGQTKLHEIAPDKSDEWRSLGVNILHELIFNSLVQQQPAQCVHNIQAMMDRLENGDADDDGKAIPLAAIVAPLSLDDLCGAAERGEALPSHANYFYPSVLSGLVFNPHEA